MQKPVSVKGPDAPGPIRQPQVTEDDPPPHENETRPHVFPTNYALPVPPPPWLTDEEDEAVL